jgi:hypothetical protein
VSRKGKAMKRRGSSKAGRPKKDGARFGNGRLKPAGPSELTLERRRELAADITQTTNPLDCAHANGWISLSDHRAGVTYAVLRQQAGLGAPGLSGAHDMSASGGVEVEVQKRTWGTMSDAEIGAIWDSAFTSLGSLEDRENAQGAAMLRWKRVSASMTAAVRHEVDLVCIQQSWPHWLIQRCAGEKLRMDATAERRALTDKEQAYIAQKFHTTFEAKRDLLLIGLKAVRDTMAAEKGPRPIELPRPPKAPLPRWAKITEKTTYIDSDGNVLRKAVRLIANDGA